MCCEIVAALRQMDSLRAGVEAQSERNDIHLKIEGILSRQDRCSRIAVVRSFPFRPVAVVEDSFQGVRQSSMKTFTLFGVLAVAAQMIVSNVLAAEGTSTEYSVKARSANSKTWERTEVEILPDGAAITRLHRYEEIASGLCVLDPKTGHYEDADESFEITADGYAVARHTQHQLIISPSLGDPAGNTDLRTPEGRRLRSSIVGLNLHNRATGADLFLAEVSPDAEGHLVAPNEIVFSNAFTGFAADVRILNGKWEIHADVLLNEALDLKELEAAGFPAADSVMEIWTEYWVSHEPVITSRLVQREASAVKRAAMLEPDIVTDDLDFGIMKMPSGKGYLRGGEPTPDPPKRGSNEVKKSTCPSAG